MPVVLNDGSYYPTIQVRPTVGISTNTLFSWLKEGAFPDVGYWGWRGWRLFSTVQVEAIRPKTSHVLAIGRSN